MSTASLSSASIRYRLGRRDAGRLLSWRASAPFYRFCGNSSMRRDLDQSDVALAAVRAQARTEYVQEELRVIVHRSARLAQVRPEQLEALRKSADDYGQEILRLTKQNASASLPQELSQAGRRFRGAHGRLCGGGQRIGSAGVRQLKDLTSTIDALEKLRVDIRPLRQGLARSLAEYHASITAGARSANAPFSEWSGSCCWPRSSDVRFCSFDRSNTR